MLSLQLTLALQLFLHITDVRVSPATLEQITRHTPSPHSRGKSGLHGTAALLGVMGPGRVYEGHRHLAQLQKNRTRSAAPAVFPIREKPRVYFMVGDPWGLKTAEEHQRIHPLPCPPTPLPLIPIEGSRPNVKRRQTHLLGQPPQPAWGASLPRLIPAGALTLLPTRSLSQPCSFPTSLTGFLLWSCEKRGAPHGSCRRWGHLRAPSP